MKITDDFDHEPQYDTPLNDEILNKICDTRR